MIRTCSELYPCHAWDCNACFSKRVYWLREQATSFSQQLPTKGTYFSTLKGFKNAEQAKSAITLQIKLLREDKARYNAKLEYFYVISNHDFSGWHVHAVTNRKLLTEVDYCEPVESLKATVLYMVANLARSRHADYQGVRRYGASSLLNKQNLKTAYKTRRRLWVIRTRIAMVKIINSVFRSWFKVTSGIDDTPTQTPSTDHQPTIESAIKPTARPPPKKFD